MVVMIAGIHISQETFAIDVLTALKSSLEQCRKHALRLLRLYGNQVLRLTTGRKGKSDKMESGV